MALERPMRLATRKSKLAMVQSQQVADQLMQLHEGLRVELVTFDTQGDAIQNQNLSEIGGKGLFTKELEDALLDGSVDIAVHSLKDMPATLPDGLEIACIPQREDARDGFVSAKYKSISDLPDGAVIGTSSTRRAAQVKAMRADVSIVPFRGNVQTRLKKLDDGVVDATFLAVAGLNRLEMSRVITEMINPKVMLPAVGQGALAIEAKSGNSEILSLLKSLHHVDTDICIRAERSFLKKLDGSCRTPLAAFATIEGDVLTLNTMVASLDGSLLFTTSRKGRARNAEQMGVDAANQLIDDAGADVIAGWKK